MDKLSIIVADDHPIFRDGICSVLKKQEFVSKISQAGDGTEVIRLLELERYDLVMLDIRMSPMNGFKAMEEIASRFPHVKVIALSMFNEEKYILEMVNLGAQGYLLKNAGKSEIIAAIKSVSRGGTYFSQEVSDSIVDKIKGVAKFKDESGKPYFEERIREIIYLMCMEKTSKEIAEIMSLSVRTIEDYRTVILDRTNSKNIVGVIKHAMASGLVDDELLKARFEGKV